jgi:ubiquinone/menaquinone biosynthesis C-methylase UbiE
VEKLSYLELLAEYGVGSAHPGGLSLTGKVLRNEYITPDMELLDIGCGTGQTAVYIAKNHPCQLTAADINPKMLDQARQKFAAHQLNIPLFQANAMDLPFRKHSFDLVLSESVTIFTNINKTLREYFQVLKPGGRLLAIEATALAPLTREETNDFQKVLGIHWMPVRDEWCQMLQDAGFSKVQVIVERRMNWLQSFSPWMKQLLSDYVTILFRHRSKFGYGVYRALKAGE